LCPLSLVFGVHNFAYQEMVEDDCQFRFTIYIYGLKSQLEPKRVTNRKDDVSQ